VPVGCGLFSLSDQSEPVATVTQADAFEPIIPASKLPTGYLPWSSSASASGGYQGSIRLDVPAGRAETQPKLALQYASGAGVDALGPGWSIAGSTSIIRPCAPTFATNGHVDFPTQLCLDQQPLVEIGSSGEYRTENESYAQVLAQPAGAAWPESWVVRLKDGRVRTYAAVRYAGSNTRLWALEREEDRRGNAITFTYDHHEYWDECSDLQKQVPGLYPHCASPYTHWSFRIAQIDYTSRGDEGPRRKVVFHYAPPDPSRPPTYLRVWDREKQSYDFMDVSGLLDKIEMHGPGDPWQGAPELAWSYDLAYTISPDTGRPLLSSVTKCSASGGCLLAREFNYSERSPGADDSYEVLWERTLGTSITSDELRVFDANNDGKDDIYRWVDLLQSVVYLFPDPNTSTHTTNTFLGPDSTPVDLDGDGVAELIGTRTVSLDPLVWERWAYKASAAGTIKPWVKVPDTPAMYPDDPFVTGYHPLYIETFPSLFADLDGDSLPDLCRARPGYSLLPANFPTRDSIDWYWTCALSLGNGSFGLFGQAEHITFYGDGPTYLADLDHDGRAEFHQGEELIGDADGDGLNEVIASGTLDDFTLGDVDGDGRTDKVIDATLTVQYARDSSAVQDLSAYRPGAGNVPVGTYRGDFDGNGRDDLLLVWNDANGDAHLKAITMVGPDPDRLVEVRDEDADWRERVTYSRTPAPDGDPQDGSAPYPNTRVRRGFSVVTRLESRTGTPRDRHFAYSMPTYDRHGRGFLGFGRVVEWQPDRPALLVSLFDNNQASDGGVYPAAFHPGMTLEVVPILEQPVPGAPVPHPSLATARIRRTEHRYQLDKRPTGTFSIIPDPGSSWNSDAWEQEVAIDWNAWPPIDWWSLAQQAIPPVAKRREGIVGLDGFGNVVVSMEKTLGGQHPTLGAIGGTKTTTWITYDYRPQDWLVSLPHLVTVKSDAADGSSETRTTEYHHDAWGMLASIEHEPGGSASENQLLEFTRNDDGLITAVTATAGGPTVRALHVAYDEERVHRTHTWNDDGHMASVKIHPTLAVPMSSTDPNGVKDHWVHDDLGRLRYELPQAGNARTTDYEPWVENGLVRGTIVHTSGEDGSEGEVRLDDRGRRVTLRSRDFAGQWRSASVERDLLGRVGFEERPHYAGAPAPGTGVRYDSLDRVVETTLPDSTSRKSTHGLFGAIHHDAQQNEQHVTYDFDGRAVQTIRKALPLPWDPGSTLTSSVVYGPFGQVKTTTDPAGNQTQMLYDHRGRRYETIDPDRGTTTVHYNGHGEIEWAQTATDTLSYTRDDLGRVTQVVDTEGVSTTTWDTSPNGIGKLAAAQSVDGTKVDYTYDAVGRVQDVTWTLVGAGPPLVVSRAYNSLGQLKTVEYPDVAGLGRTKIGYIYNARGYLEHVFDVSPTVPSSLLWTVKERNQDDALRKAQGGDWTTTLDYDEQSGRLEEIKVLDAAAQTSLLHLTYERDDNGFVDRRTEHAEGREEVFHLDGHHRLKEWLLDYGKGGAGSGSQVSIYTYDSIDNLGKVSVSGSAIVKYDDLFTHGSSGKPHALYNRAKKANPQTFFYDARGRLLDGDGQQYTYTSFDLPRSITTPAGSTQFNYDASGSRVGKQGPSGTTTSLRGLFESHEGAGGFRYTFVVHSSDGPVAEIVYKPSEPNPRTVQYRHHDALGSVSVTTAQGGLANRRYHESFGAHVGFDGSAATPPMDGGHDGFTGHPHDDDLGLIDMGGRIYSPSTRQFLTPDPLGRLGASPYSYVRNNPLNWIDPSGFTEEDPEGYGYSGFTNLFRSAPIAAIDVSPSLISHVAASLAAMDFPNGNDAPNSSGCPNGTGTAPLPCAAPGAAGCAPGAGSPPQNVYDAYYTQSQLTALAFASALMKWPSFGTALDFAYAEANSRPDAGVEPAELPIAGPPGASDAEWEGGMLADSAMRTMTGMAADVMVLTVAAQGIVTVNAARAAPTLSADKDLLAQFGPRVPTRSGGYFNVVTHADANIAYILRDGRWTSVHHRTLARFIQKSPEYTGGPVRLVACNSGACTTGLAQNLSNKMGVEVLAPTGNVFIDSTGSFWTNGTWQTFTPGL
jgi:RHS repeat-associated protein